VYLRNFTFDNVHVDASRALAEVSAESGVAKFVQVSALNASEDSISKFLRTKVK
jgi:NADH dehydrogenase (ubiquinone) 1 alpha subcomplex subunit 9